MEAAEKTVFWQAQTGFAKYSVWGEESAINKSYHVLRVMNKICNHRESLVTPNIAVLYVFFAKSMVMNRKWKFGKTFYVFNRAVQFFSVWKELLARTNLDSIKN